MDKVGFYFSEVADVIRLASIGAGVVLTTVVIVLSVLF